MARICIVYIMANARHNVLYTGVTRDLRRRIWQHRSGAGRGFTKRYHCIKLVYFEASPTPSTAIAREKQIKAGPRRSKVKLIEQMNPGWKDLYDALG